MADLPEPVVQVTGYTVTCLPEDDVEWGGTFTIRVERRAPDRWGDCWAVCRLSRCLSTSGTWDYESIPSERADEWLVAHRFNRHTALRLAKAAAPLITVNGFTVADALDRLAAAPERTDTP